MTHCPHYSNTSWWSLSTGQKKCKQCGLRRYFKTKRLFDLMRISFYWKGRLVKFFCLGVPAYRLRFQVPYSQPTIQRLLRILRETIYQQTMKELEPLSGEIEWQFNNRNENLVILLHNLLNQRI